MECKYAWSAGKDSLVLVLIETLWNVNSQSIYIRRLQDPRINRNIVECKYNFTGFAIHVSFVLIETLWNVNTIKIWEVVRFTEY